jgi:hypothetical protein
LASLELDSVEQVIADAGKLRQLSLTFERKPGAAIGFPDEFD